jgi:hypothetical protein
LSKIGNVYRQSVLNQFLDGAARLDHQLVNLGLQLRSEIYFHAFSVGESYGSSKPEPGLERRDESSAE